MGRIGGDLKTNLARSSIESCPAGDTHTGGDETTLVLNSAVYNRVEYRGRRWPPPHAMCPSHLQMHQLSDIQALLHQLRVRSLPLDGAVLHPDDAIRMRQVLQRVGDQHHLREWARGMAWFIYGHDGAGTHAPHVQGLMHPTKTPRNMHEEEPREHQKRPYRCVPKQPLSLSERVPACWPNLHGMLMHADTANLPSQPGAAAHRLIHEYTTYALLKKSSANM